MYSIGIDLGGTNIAAGVVDENGKIIVQASRPTGAHRPYQQVIADMAAAALEVIEKAGISISQVRAIGVGVPGYAEQETGLVKFCNNLGWDEVPLIDEMRKHISLPVYADNDATLAGYAEYMVGVSRGTKNSVFLTLGTGVGACLIIGGKIYGGAHNVAGELGHMTYDFDGEDCTCGARGCFECYASATALIRIGKEKMAKYPQSILQEKAETLSARDVIDAAREKDPCACEAFDEYTTHLAMGIVSIINFVDPEVIVLGGGVSKAGAILLDTVKEKVEKFRFYKTLPCGEVKLAALGNEAGIIGAAMLGLE